MEFAELKEITPEESFEEAEELPPEAIALLEHFGEILAKEYVELMKADRDEKEENQR